MENGSTKIRDNLRRRRDHGGRVRNALATALTIAVSGCATSAPEIPPEAVVTRTERYATRVMMLPSCPVTGPKTAGQTPMAGALLAPLLSVVTSIVADTITSAIVAAIKERQDGLSVTYVGRGASKLAYDSTRMECLVIVRGPVGAGVGQEVAVASGSLDKVKLASIGLTDYPDLYIEASVNRSAVAGDDDQLIIAPQVLYFRNTAAPYVDKPAKSIFVSLRLTPALPPAKPVDKLPDDSINFLFDKVPLGTEVRVAAGMPTGGSNAPMSPQHPFADQAVALTMKDKSLDQTLNMQVQITESEDPSLIMKALASAMDKNKDKFSTALQQMITQAITDAKPAGGK